MFDGILVINPRDFVDRREHISTQLKDAGLNDYEFIHDYDIGDISYEINKKFFKQECEMTIRQKSCALKHIVAHEIVKKRGLKRCLILEDDVILSTSFNKILSLASTELSQLPNPKVLFIGEGGNFYTKKSKLVAGQYFYLNQKGRFGDSYIIDDEVANLRLNWIYNNKLLVPCDNTFDQIDKRLGISIYWLEPTIISQGSKNGLYASTLVKSPSKFKQYFKYRWEKIRRKYLYRLFN